MPTTRASVTLPVDVSREIIQKTQEASAVMRLARNIHLPGTGISIPVITGDPTAQWVDEGELKPVDNPAVEFKRIQGYKIAVIEAFSEEFTRDAKRLYDALISRMPGALSACFDATVIGAVAKPGEYFDNFASCTGQSLIATTGHSAYDGLVAADTDVATHGGLINGYVLSPQARGILLSAVDSTGRPLFVNSVAEGAIPMILGAPAYMNKGAYKAPVAASGSGDSAVAAAPSIVGVTGDWTKAVYGTVEGVKIKKSTEATLTVGSGASATTINLFQQNMVGIIAEIEVGFRADLSVFNLLTGAAA